MTLDIVIVERLGTLKALSVKDFKSEDLYRRCGFKKAEDFHKQTEWNVKHEGKRYVVQVFAKAEGRANSENKYDFPPPIDTKLFYGSCAVVAQVKLEDGTKEYTNLSVAMWEKVYEKLFGGFEDLAKTAKEDEEEEDELAHVPKEKKTKHGYLKDGFVVDSSDTEDLTPSVTDEDAEEDEEDEEDEDTDDEDEEDDGGNDLILEDVYSELSEESYDYDDKDVGGNK
jgi:hypothetical protein